MYNAYVNECRRDKNSRIHPKYIVDLMQQEHQQTHFMLRQGIAGQARLIQKMEELVARLEETMYARRLFERILQEAPLNVGISLPILQARPQSASEKGLSPHGAKLNLRFFRGIYSTQA